LVPSFSKDDNSSFQTINARIETIDSKPLYRRLIHRRRCIVLMEGFFEWSKKTASNSTQPFLFYRGQPLHQRSIPFSGDDTQKQKTPVAEDEWNNNLLFVAALFDTWHPRENPDTKNLLCSVSIVTCKAVDSVSFCHDRMPLILATNEQRDSWLNIDLYTYEQCMKLSAFGKIVENTVVQSCSVPRGCVGNTENRSIQCVTPLEECEKPQKQNAARFFEKKRLDVS